MFIKLKGFSPTGSFRNTPPAPSSALQAYQAHPWGSLASSTWLKHRHLGNQNLNSSEWIREVPLQPLALSRLGGGLHTDRVVACVQTIFFDDP